MLRVGIPRGLFYFYYYPLWKTFFLDLGAEVVTSAATTRSTMERGIRLAVDETCLPVKTYLGHIHELCQQQLDYLFVPRLVSVESRSYICPKFMGIPDMVRALVPGLPPLLDITVDLSRTERNLKRDVLRLGRLFGANPRRVREVLAHARQENLFCQSLAAGGYTLEEAIDIWEGRQVDVPLPGDLQVAVLGHGYSLYDKRVSMNLITRLRALGCRVHMVEEQYSDLVEKEAAKMPKRVFWTLGRKMVGTALHLDQRDDIDGMIYLACFGCGPDSLIGEVVESKVKNKPFMLVTVDEHTGEGGLVTRLEAFCDMLRRRRSANHESNLSAHG